MANTRKATTGRSTKKKPAAAPSKGTGLDALQFDRKNARKHGDRNLALLQESLTSVGAGRSIVIDDAGTVLAGEGTVRAARAAGLQLRIVDTDRHTLVAVRRSDLSPDEKTRLALLDNRTAELAEWNPEVLEALAAEGVDLSALWDARELEALLGDSRRPGKTDPDAVPALRRTSIRPGDLFELGRHRLLCGDSTASADVRAVLRDETPRLMVTDPPYGVNYDPTWRQREGVSKSARTGKVANDHRADWREAWDLFPGDVAYVWHGGIFSAVVDASLVAASFELRAQIIWRKPRIVLSRGHYHWQHETAFYAVRKGRTAHWTGRRNQATAWAITPTVHRCQSCGSVEIESAPDEVPSTIWDIEPRDKTGDTTHGTQKPVECMARPMRNHVAPLVYEPFSGSGSSIIAAEQTGRGCRAIELNPEYVQQALDRWEAFTGGKAVKAGEVGR